MITSEGLLPSPAQVGLSLEKYSVLDNDRLNNLAGTAKTLSAKSLQKPGEPQNLQNDIDRLAEQVAAEAEIVKAFKAERLEAHVSAVSAVEENLVRGDVSTAYETCQTALHKVSKDSPIYYMLMEYLDYCEGLMPLNRYRGDGSELLRCAALLHAPLPIRTRLEAGLNKLRYSSGDSQAIPEIDKLIAERNTGEQTVSAVVIQERQRRWTPLSIQ